MCPCDGHCDNTAPPTVTVPWEALNQAKRGGAQIDRSDAAVVIVAHRSEVALSVTTIPTGGSNEGRLERSWAAPMTPILVTVGRSSRLNNRSNDD